MSKIVAAACEGRAAMPRSHAESFSLYASTGARKYLNREERTRALAAMQTLPLEHALAGLMLGWTGARVTEVLELTPLSFQVERSVVSIKTLKRRRHAVRQVPIPSWLMAGLDLHYRIKDAQRDPARAYQRLWPCHRTTVWRNIKHIMMLTEIVGPGACPRGLRHSFGVGTLQAGVPLNLLQRWLGHARMSTTAIHADVCGEEEHAFAARFWRAADQR
jgi:integrase/recombinase XerD